MTPRQMKGWIKEHAHPRTYCPIGDGHLLSDKAPWLWIINNNRGYVICENCALGWAGGRNVRGPEEFPEILTENHQWIAEGSGLLLAPDQAPLVTDDDLLKRWVAEVRERLKGCHCCGSTEESVTTMVSVRDSRWILAICLACLTSGSEELLDLRGAGVIKEVADRLSDVIFLSMPLDENEAINREMARKSLEP